MRFYIFIFIIGFIFGAIGLSIISFISSSIPFLENAVFYLEFPGRFAHGIFSGLYSFIESNYLISGLIVLLFNGIFYAMVGLFIGLLLDSDHKH
jgi:hypothetical protein